MNYLPYVTMCRSCFTEGIAGMPIQEEIRTLCDDIGNATIRCG